MVVELLDKGRENAKTTEELVRACNFTNKRDLTLQIAKEREAGAVICSTTSGEGGYYLPDNPKELRAFINSMDNRAINIFRAVKSAKKMLKELESKNNGK